MSIRLTIKFDNCKLRLYLEGYTPLIAFHLALKGYEDARKVLINKKQSITKARMYINALGEKLKTFEEEQASRRSLDQMAQQLKQQAIESNAVPLPASDDIPQEQHLTQDLAFLCAEFQQVSSLASKQVEAYVVPPYHFIYDNCTSEPERFLMIQFSFPVVEHLTDQMLEEAIKSLIAPLNLTEPISLPPVLSLRARVYQVVFCQTMEPNLALQVVQNFEDLAKDISKAKDPHFTKLLSQVKMYYDPLTLAVHLPRSGMFSADFRALQTRPATAAQDNCSCTIV